jgi:hypothetical protein
MRKSTSFRHPVDTRHDDRIALLIADHGPAGYGIYWMIIEMLHNRETMQIEYDKKMIRRMAAQTGMKHEEFHNLLQDMIYDYDLFEIADCVPSMGQQGFIRSTIIYRKPRKPKQAPKATNIKELEDTNTSAHASYQEAIPPLVNQEEDDTCPPSVVFSATSHQQSGTATSAIQQHRGSQRAAQRHRNSSTTARQQQHYSSKNTV